MSEIDRRPVARDRRRTADTSAVTIALLVVLCLMQAVTLCLVVTWELRYQDMQRALKGFQQGFSESLMVEETPEERKAQKARNARKNREFQKALHDAFAPFRNE